MRRSISQIIDSLDGVILRFTQNDIAEHFFSYLLGRRGPGVVYMKALKLALAILAFSAAACAADVTDCRLVRDWGPEGPARIFTTDNLFEYVDGNADGYLTYGFIRLENSTCKSGSNSVVIDVSEMTDADAAYAIFAANRDPDAPIATIGMGGQIQPRRAIFCKDKYYVELADNSSNENTSALQAFVVEMEKRIPGRSAPPDALSWFSTDKLTSVRLVPESVLGLPLLKRGYVAEYETGKAFAVAEKSSESASEVMDKLRKSFGHTMPAQVAEESFRAKDRYLGSLCFFRKGRYLGGFADLPEGYDAAGLAAALAARMP
jgi:hypothetical protein